MADRPVIFSAPMVKALLEGRKSQTRRVLKLPKRTHSGGPIYERPDMGGWAATTIGGGGCFTIGRDGRRLPVPERPAIWHQTTGVVMALPFDVGDRLWVKHAADCFPIYFKPIPFGCGKYAVGTDGHVYARSDDEWARRAPRLSHNGYEEISLRYNGEHRPFRINRLVAEAFYGPAPDGYVCRHIDGRRRNNAPENLDWGTSRQNSADASAAGSFSGERASQARLSLHDVEAIRQSSEPQAVLAERFGITQPTVSKIKRGKRWADTGDAPPRNYPEFSLWRSPIFCPRWASRLTLTVTDVRVQRIQDISEDDAFEEGVTRLDVPLATYKAAFRDLWNHLHGPHAWDRNDWVAAYTFEVARGNIDQIGGAA